MTTTRDTGTLAQIPTDSIRPNPDNPRIVFRPGELEELQESIRQFGVQVPISVFKRGSSYILIDGERRWRCASKLNLRKIPALIQREPKPLENLLLMFNIHALREQWDLMTIALKLPDVTRLLRRDLGHEPNENDLSLKTGLTRSVIRRCRLLSGLSREHQALLLHELQKPKNKQELSEDFFIEMERALKTVSRAMPDAIGDLGDARDMLLSKYRRKIFENITDLRKLPKISRADAVGVSAKAAGKALRRIVSDPDYSIAEAWEDTVSEAYSERDLVTRIEQLLRRLESIAPRHLDPDLRASLVRLAARSRALLSAGK